MKKKEILSKIFSSVVIFIFILGFVNIYTHFFGKENNLVGVTIVIAILVLMQENLTVKPISNTFILLILSEMLGIFSHFAKYNIYLGFVLNFTALFLIGYFLSFKKDKVLIVPFGLQYLFMLYTPVEGRSFSLRLIGLAVGVLLIMISQFIVHMKSDKSIHERPKLIMNIKNSEDIYKNIRIFGVNFNVHYIRGSYAVRVGLITAISALIVSIFNFDQGRWIVYTVFSLTELYSEHCIERSRQRLEGTVIGALIIAVLFIFIKSSAVRGLIVLAGGYLDSFSKNYRQKMICVTISVIASVSIANGTMSTIMQRIAFVISGIALSLIVDRFVFNRKLDSDNTNSAITGNIE